MSVLDEYRRNLSLLQTENMELLGNIADTEERLNSLKKRVTELYEKVDDVLDLEIKEK